MLNVKPNRTGLHQVEVRELSRQAGPRFGFDCILTSGIAAFSLAIDKNLIDVQPEKGAEVKLTLNRRDGSGPIELHLEGAPDFRLEPSRIEGKGRDHTVRILAPIHTPGIGPWRARLIGTSDPTNAPFKTVALTRGPALAQWPTLHQPPGDWNGIILLRTSPVSSPEKDP